MTDPEKNKARGRAGSDAPAGGQAGKATKQNKALDCGTHHINKIVREIRRVGLQLHSTSGATQLATLPKVLEYLGSRGANTYELVALGFLRAATRVKELESLYQIASLREDVMGPDGLFHKGVARYVMLGKRKDLPTQGALDLGAP